MNKPAELTISVAEAMRLTSMGETFILGLCRSGKIKAVKAGRRWLIDPTSLQRWLRTLRHPDEQPNSYQQAVAKADAKSRRAA